MDEIKVGDRFGSRTIVETNIKIYNNKQGFLVYRVKCDCGKEMIAKKGNLLRSQTCISCANRHKNQKRVFIPKVGDIFGDWKILQNNILQDGKIYSLCRCKCNNESMLLNNRLTKATRCKKCISMIIPTSINDYGKTYYKPSSYFNKKDIRPRRNALHKSANYDIDIELDRQNNICPLSGITLFKTRHNNKPGSRTPGFCNISDDRIDSNGEYHQDNVRALFQPINMMLGRMSDKLFIEICTLIAEYAKKANHKFDENGNIKKESYYNNDTSIPAMVD